MDTEGQMETRTHGFQLQVRENATNGSCNHKLSHYFLQEKDGRSHVYKSAVPPRTQNSSRLRLPVPPSVRLILILRLIVS